jgi:hypothetical protein
MGPEYPFGAISNFYENFVFIANLFPGVDDTGNRLSCNSRNSPGLDPRTLRHSKIWGAADEAVLNKVL